LLEELGIHAEIAEEVWRTVHRYPGHAPIELIFFSVRWYQGEPENRAFQQIRWVRPQETTTYDFLEADRPLIEQLSARAGS
jgi:8-oxo-dGTP pyrophosphatase MutT (NUDIX family)